MLSANDVLQTIEDNEVRFVDFRFTDPRGKEMHFSMPASQVDEHTFEEGNMFDGSSIDGWKGINTSDMIMMPDVSTAVLDPFMEERTLNIRCDIVEPDTMHGYERDPRTIAKRAEAYLQQTGIADEAYFGPEPEFFIFDNVRWKTEMSGMSYKPIVGDNGSGMHVHQSLFKGGENLFAGDQYGGLSETALYYIGGVIKHAHAINAFSNASTNSYKRLVPGFEAPVMLAYSARNRSASVRIPWVSNQKARRIEVRFPDPTGNPYFTFSALMMAGLDGIKNKIHPGDAIDKDLYDLPPEEDAMIPKVASSLDQALEGLNKDREFLTAGGVFTNEQLDAYIELKMEEVTRLRMSTHPVEFDMYYSL